MAPKGRSSPTPKRIPKGTKPPAQDYMQLSEDAITLLRYVKAIERELLIVAPDADSRKRAEKSLTRCRDAMSTITAARLEMLSRYTPYGDYKPDKPGKARTK